MKSAMRISFVLVWVVLVQFRVSHALTGATDSEGVLCTQKASSIAQEFLSVVDLSHLRSVPNVKAVDSLQTVKYKSLTPGSLDQRYEVETLIQAKDIQSTSIIKFEMTGDYECDNLRVAKIKSVKRLKLDDSAKTKAGKTGQAGVLEVGGVERVD